MAASWKLSWETAEPSRIQQYIRDPAGGIKGEDLPRHLWTKLKPSARWHWLLQIFYEEVGPFGQCSMRVWRNGTDRQAYNHRLPPIQPTLRSWPFPLRTRVEGMAARHRVGYLMIHERRRRHAILFFTIYCSLQFPD